MNSPSSRISRFVTQDMAIQYFHSHQLMTKKPVINLQKTTVALVSLCLLCIILYIDVNYWFISE